MRCPSGTRKNRKGECVKSTRLEENDITELIKKNKISERARPILRRMRLNKHYKGLHHEYTDKKGDALNMFQQVEDRILGILKYAPLSRRKRIRSVRRRK